MRKTLGTVTYVVTILTPVTALAMLFTRPSQVLLPLLEPDGRPTAFSAEVHVSETGGEVAAWIKAEAQAPNSDISRAQARGYVTVHVRHIDKTERVRLRFLLTRSVLYVRLLEVSGMPDSLRNAWISAPLEYDGMRVQTNVFASISEALKKEGVTLTESQIKEIAAKFIDAAFVMQGTSAAAGGGAEYSIRLQPQFLTNLVAAYRDVINSTPELKSDATLIISSEDQAEMRVYQGRINKSLNFHLKVAHDADGMLTGQKIYTSFTYEDKAVVFQAQRTIQSTPVTVVAPTANVIPYEQLKENMSGSASWSSSSAQRRTYP